MIKVGTFFYVFRSLLRTNLKHASHICALLNLEQSTDPTWQGVCTTRLEHFVRPAVGKIGAAGFLRRFLA